VGVNVDGVDGETGVGEALDPNGLTEPQPDKTVRLAKATTAIAHTPKARAVPKYLFIVFSVKNRCEALLSQHGGCRADAGRPWSADYGLDIVN
jgi:hypothetical protein